MEDKTPRAVKWNLNNINKALIDIDFSEIEEAK